MRKLDCWIGKVHTHGHNHLDQGGPTFPHKRTLQIRCTISSLYCISSSKCRHWVSFTFACIKFSLPSPAHCLAQESCESNAGWAPDLKVATVAQVREKSELPPGTQTAFHVISIEGGCMLLFLLPPLEAAIPCLPITRKLTLAALA